MQLLPVLANVACTVMTIPLFYQIKHDCYMKQMNNVVWQSCHYKVLECLLIRVERLIFAGPNFYVVIVVQH